MTGDKSREDLAAELGAAMEGVFGPADDIGNATLDAHLRAVAIQYAESDEDAAVLSLRAALYQAAAIGALFMFASREGLSETEITGVFESHVRSSVPDADAKIKAATRTSVETAMGSLKTILAEASYADDLAEYGAAVANLLRDNTDRFMAEDHSACEGGPCTLADRYSAECDEIIASAASSKPRGQG